MFEDYTVPTRRMTPDDVLAVFRDDFRQAASIPPGVDHRVSVSFSTTVDAWFYARCDLMPFRRLGESFNAQFKTTFTERQWRNVLYPPKERTLRDVCELVASIAERPVIRPINVLGRPCAEAAAFLSVRKLLADGGADVADLAPSSLVEPYLKRWSSVFFTDIAQLAPGCLPTYQAIPKCKHGSLLWRLLGVGWITAPVGLLVAMIFEPSRSWAIPVTLGAFAVTAICVAVVILIGPPHQRFGTALTFRDLSKELAAGGPT